MSHNISHHTIPQNKPHFESCSTSHHSTSCITTCKSYHIPHHTTFIATFHSTTLHIAHLASPHSTSGHIPYHTTFIATFHSTALHTAHLASLRIDHILQHHITHHHVVRTHTTFHITLRSLPRSTAPHSTSHILHRSASITFYSTTSHTITLCTHTPDCTSHISVHIAQFRITPQHHILHHTTCGITTSQTTGHAHYHILHHTFFSSVLY